MQFHDAIDAIDPATQAPRRRNIFQTKNKHSKNVDMEN
jgi:hypothetical protein